MTDGGTDRRTDRGADDGERGVRKPRIAILGEKYFPSRGGTSRVVESKVRHLADRYDFTVYCYRHPEAERNVPGVRVVQFPEIRLKGLGVFLHYLRCALHCLRGDFDLVHVHKTDAAFVLPLLALRFPCVATSHEQAYLNSKWSGIGRLYFRLVERLFVRSRATLTCVSREQQRHYVERYGREVHFVPNGVEPLSQDDGDAEALLREAGVPADFVLFAARRIIPLKGAQTLIEALRRLDDPPPLVVLGDLEQMPAFTAELRERARGLDVRFLGYVADRATLLGIVRRASLFVFPSEREGMSVMLLEVAATGTPIVCSDIPQNADVLDADESVRFPSRDADALAEALAWARANPEELRARAEEARRKVEARYTARGVALQYARLYEGRLGLSGAPAPESRPSAPTGRIGP